MWNFQRGAPGSVSFRYAPRPGLGSLRRRPRSPVYASSGPVLTSSPHRLDQTRRPPSVAAHPDARCQPPRRPSCVVTTRPTQPSQGQSLGGPRQMARGLVGSAKGGGGGGGRGGRLDRHVSIEWRARVAVAGTGTDCMDNGSSPSRGRRPHRTRQHATSAVASGVACHAGPPWPPPTCPVRRRPMDFQPIEPP